PNSSLLSKLSSSSSVLPSDQPEKKMEKAQSSSSLTSLMRTKSDQLVETMAAAMAAMKSPMSSDQAGGGPESSGTLSRKSSKRLAAASPGRSNGSTGKNTHIRKSRSAQLKFDIDEVNSGAALSRASSASLGFSFSFTGFTVPADDVADLRSFSDDETRKCFEFIAHM
ncbi:unnamed protein product, partial [Ilex paraguariensis]